MSKDKKGGSEKPTNVIPLRQGCLCEGCKRTPSRAGFCDEHFDWFKAGLITKAGHKAKDFDKKYRSFTHKKVA